jgi:hypothetical protein
MFPVIGEGKAQAKISYYGGPGLKFRFSPAENLEIFGTGGISFLTQSSYGVGARYQIVPNFSAFLDFGIPASDGESFGLVPGAQFSLNFGDKLSLGFLAGVGIDTDAPNNKYDDNLNEESGAVAHLGISAELDYMINDNLGIAVGADFYYDRLGGYENREDLEFKNAFSPYFAVFNVVDKIVVATAVGLRLNAVNKDGKESVGLWGGVEATLTF